MLFVCRLMKPGWTSLKLNLEFNCLIRPLTYKHIDNDPNKIGIIIINTITIKIKSSLSIQNEVHVRVCLFTSLTAARHHSRSLPCLIHSHFPPSLILTCHISSHKPVFSQLCASHLLQLEKERGGGEPATVQLNKDVERKCRKKAMKMGRMTLMWDVN